MRFSKRKRENKRQSLSDSASGHQQMMATDAQGTTCLQTNIEAIVAALGASTDLIVREIEFGRSNGVKAGLLYLEGLVDSTAVQEVLMSLIQQSAELGSFPSAQAADWARGAISVGAVKTSTDMRSSIDALLSGDTLLLLDGLHEQICVSTSGPEHRSVSEPITQTVIRGPHEAFTETLRVNTSLLRRKIKDQNLWLETRRLGRVTQTSVAVMYIKGIVDDAIIQEVHRRLDLIDIDGILEGGYIEELIAEKRRSVFPTMNNSERPDVVAAALLEGRVAILVDGTPFVLIVPSVFIDFFHAAEDYYHLSDFGLLRLLRLTSFFLALLAPSLYIAVTTFHQEMLPTSLLISLAAQREGIPFPALAEALIMEITFEFLREAGIRMPRAVGTAISIVGALVLGQAAVQAGLVSPAMVIIVSITAITSFIFPNYEFGIATRILRFPMMLLAATVGIFGMTVGMLALLFHLTSLRSFGIPYLSPFTPLRLQDQKDALIRAPWRMLLTRPLFMFQKNSFRQKRPRGSQGGADR